MKILVKFATRSRPEKFFQRMHELLSMQTNQNHYLVSIDEDDPTMNNEAIISELKAEGVQVVVGKSLGKVDAINRDIEKSKLKDWDILVLGCDDMRPTTNGWDQIIIDEMKANFPDTDGLLWHFDGNEPTRRKNGIGGLNTLPIIGRTYYERFNYIYNPSYISLFCDNEMMDVADQLKKCFYSDYILFRHEHPAFCVSVKSDELMKKNESYYHTDRETYLQRRIKNFENA